MVGMRSMDVPDRGQARSPAELLDNLRLRLSQLADNHPSAPRRGEPGERPLRDGADAVPEGAELARPDVMPEGGDESGRDGSGGGGPGIDGPDGGGPGGGGPDGGEPDGGGAGGPMARGGLGDLDLPGLRAASEAYRPWFVAGEPGAPWWVASDDL
jgi:hypothetical protein